MRKKTFCLSLDMVERYITRKKYISQYPNNSELSHAIRQVVEIAMQTFDEQKLVCPALPEKFIIDSLPKELERDLKTFLATCLKAGAVEIATKEKDSKKLEVFLKIRE